MSKTSAVLCASVIGISLGEVLQHYHFKGEWGEKLKICNGYGRKMSMLDICTVEYLVDLISFIS